MDTPKALRILAVDDNRTNLHILQVFLKKLGHEVILAENGEDALQRFDQDRPDVVLLDIMMPVMDGFEAARRMRARSSGRWVPIVFLSALNRDENLLEGLESGGDDYLSKPINFVVLEARMRSMQKTLTLQRQSTEALERLQAISDSVFEAIITIDDQAVITSSNRATERIFGWKAEEMLGKNIRMLMPEPCQSAHDAYLKAYKEGGPPQIMSAEREVLARRKDGSVFQAELGVSEIRTEEQQAFVGVIRDISERKRVEQQLRENAEQLQAYYERTENEQQLAIKLVETQLHRRSLQDRCLRYKVIPAQHFSGDIVAAARSPRGCLYALLADATGHGLAAAITVLPLLTVFYRMAASDQSVQELVLELNRQLRETMPVDHFVAATLIRLDESIARGEIWIGGMPEALFFDHRGKLLRKFASTQLPLGIVDNPQLGAEPVVFGWECGHQLLLCSDGLLEAENAEGQPFGEAGLIKAALNLPPAGRFDAIQTALAQHLGETLADDDISLMLIDCPPGS